LRATCPYRLESPSGLTACIATWSGEQQIEVVCAVIVSGKTSRDDQWD
jgi:hypothetical protein